MDGRGADDAPIQLRATRGLHLRRVLVTTDVAATTAGWALAAAVVGGGSALFWLAMLPAVVVSSVLALAAQGLYRSRTCATIALETLGAARAVAWLAIPGAMYAASVLGPRGIVATLGVALLVWSTLLAGRSAYRTWINARRRAGAHARTLLVIGGDERTMDLVRPIERQPQLGFRVVGIVGPEGRWNGSSSRRLGGLEDLERIVRETDVSGAIVDAGTLDPGDLNRTVRTLNRLRVHVHLSSGLRGIAANRLHPYALAHEGLLYVEPARMSPWAQAAKRVFDVVVGSAVLLLTAPVLAIAGLAVRLEDGGPVVFRQERVGLGGRTFTLYKLRTMSVDAEERKAELEDLNQREGPLFKMAADPRVTAVGRILRASSIDELPQLINVLQGRMSLVGPRPALPREVAEFDDELLVRADVKPGVSGLWQVEARDDASFDAYRRLDIFYVENWSLGLDATIVLLTIPVVLSRLFDGVRRRVGRSSSSSPLLD